MSETQSDVEAEIIWARSLTLDLLRKCTPDDLQFQLSPGFGPLWKQFRHIARVHENYISAIQTGAVRFGVQGCSYTGGCSKSALLSYFEKLEGRHRVELEKLEENDVIDWFGKRVSVLLHLTRLLNHETLHHGQLLLAWRVMGREFPKSWKSWGE